MTPAVARRRVPAVAPAMAAFAACCRLVSAAKASGCVVRSSGGVVMAVPRAWLWRCGGGLVAW